MRFIDINGLLGKARRFVNGQASVQSEDVKSDDKLAELLRKLMARVTELEASSPPAGVEFEVNCPTDGGFVSMTHNLKCPVRWSVVHWAGTSSLSVTEDVSAVKPQGLCDRSFGIGTISTAAGNFSTGTRWRMKTIKEITGVRFLWGSPGSAKTVRCKIWNDSSGAVLGTVDIAVSANGFYEGIFASAITTDLIGVDIIASIYETGGAVQSYNTDAAVNGLCPIELTPDLTLKHMEVYSAGDAKPATTGTTIHFPVEPIVGKLLPYTNLYLNGPQLTFDSATSSSTILSLKSYKAGRAIIRVEPSQYGIS